MPTLSPGYDNSSSQRVPTTKSTSDAQVFSQALHMTLGLDPVVDVLENPVRAHHEGGPDHAHGRLTVELLLTVRAVCALYRMVGVGQQREVQRLLVPELGQLGGLIRGYAQDLHTCRGQAAEAVPEVAGLRGAPGVMAAG